MGKRKKLLNVILALALLVGPFANMGVLEKVSGVENGETVTVLDFDTSKTPQEIMQNSFGTGDSKSNIEGPEGDNCAVDGAVNWESNGNLKVVNALQDTSKGANTTANTSLDNKNVFKFFLHDNKDWDRNTNIVDRQRVEIKTELSNPQINSYNGNILTNHWKFFLPADTPLPDKSSFFHIFQTKAVKGNEASMPVFTLSISNQYLYFKSSESGEVSQESKNLAQTDIKNIVGKWIEAEVTTYTVEKGYAYVKIQDISDPQNPKVLIEKGYNMDTWRRNEELQENGLYAEHNEPAVDGQMNRSKWGLYRKNDSPNPFGEATMYLADLSIIKRNSDTYVFPDGFNPRTQSQDISWVVVQETIEVKTGTEFGDINLPSQVEAYIEAYSKEKIEVQWDKGNYNPLQQGTYTIYGTLNPKESIQNPNNIKARININVSDKISPIRVNWAMNTQMGGTASIKAVSETKDNPAENFIDGSSTTAWITNSKLIQINTEDNKGYRYWVTIDLGEERTFDEIYLELGAIGSSKQFRLRNYTIYYTRDKKAYDEITDGSAGDPTTKNVTPNPLITANGKSWIAIPQTIKENKIEEGIKNVTNNIKHTYNLNEPLNGRYAMVLGEIENVDATAGGIEANVIKVIGDKPGEQSEETTESPTQQTQETTIQQTQETTIQQTQNINQEQTKERQLPKKGESFVYKNIYYKILKSTTKTKEVAAVKAVKKKSKTLIVPEYAKFQNYRYKVTTIKVKAFSKMKKLKAIVIGKNVSNIGQKAFYKNVNLKKITFKSSVIRKISFRAFYKISSKVIIRLPKKKRTVYKKMLKKVSTSKIVYR